MGATRTKDTYLGALYRRQRSRIRHRHSHTQTELIGFAGTHHQMTAVVRARKNCAGLRDRLDVVAAPPQLLDERSHVQLGPALDERDLRLADEDAADVAAAPCQHLVEAVAQGGGEGNGIGHRLAEGLERGCPRRASSATTGSVGLMYPCMPMLRNENVRADMPVFDAKRRM